MALTRRIARPLLASIFVIEGVDALRRAPRAPSEAPVDGRPGESAIDTDTLNRINGAVRIGAGLLLAVGKLRRSACVALMVSTASTAATDHRFWEEPADNARSEKARGFATDVALFGALILAAVDTEGRPSLGWRARRTLESIDLPRPTHDGSHALDPGAVPALAASAASRGGIWLGRQGRQGGGRAARRLKDLAQDASQRLAETHDTLQGAGDLVGETIRDSRGKASDSIHHTGSVLADVARRLEPVAEDLMQAGASRADDVLGKLGDRLTPS